MLERLVAFALSQRLFVALSVLLLIGAGIVVLPSLPIDAFPDVSPVQVKVIMKASGLTPEEVEQRITVPIELELLGLPNKKILRSTTKYALADITVDFEDGTDIYWARNQVSERLSNIARDLPEGVTGGLAPITSPLGEMFMFTIDSPDLSLAERRSLLDWVIRPALRTVPGVADVNSLGGHVRAFEIVPISDALAARGISYDLFRRAIETNSRNDGAGRVKQGEDSALVRIEGSIRSIDDIKAIVVDTRDGIPIRVKDVARVEVGSLTRYGAVTTDGHGETVEGLVLGLRGANAGQLVRDVRQRLQELQPALPKNVSINVFYDRSRLVGRAVGTVVRALGEATVLVIVLLLLFLGNWRASLVIALSLPLAIMIALIVMRAVGMSANLMSLGGLAIAIGMLIDALVVVVENIVGNLSKDQQGKTMPIVHTVFRSVCEVLEPVSTGVLIIIIVFVPLLALQGLEGKLFTPVALAIIFALAASLLLALTVIPVATSFLLKAAPHREPWLIRLASRGYARALDWALANERKVMVAAVVALVAAGFAYTQLGKTFMPAMDEGDIIVSVEAIPSVNLDQANAINARLQAAILARVPDVAGIVARTGSDELGLDPMGLNQTDTFLVLKPPEERKTADKSALLQQLRQVLADFPGLSLGFTQPIDMRVQEMISGVRGDVAVKIFGPDITKLNEIASKLSAILSGIDGAEDVYTTLNEGAQYYTVSVNRLEAGRLGLAVDTIAASLRTQIEGRTIGTALEGGRRTPILLRGSEKTREAPTLLASLPLTLASGAARGALSGRPHSPGRRSRQNRPRGWRSYERGSIQCSRSRHGGLCRSCAAEGSHGSCAAAGLSAHLGWPVRKSATRRRALVCRRAGCNRTYLRSAFYHFWLNPPGADGPGEHPLRSHRRCLRARADRRVSVRSGFGRIHRAARHRCVERCCTGILLQSVARPWRAGGSHCRGGREAPTSAGADDRQHYRARTCPAVVRFRSRIGNSKAAGHRGNRRVAVIDTPDADTPANPLSPVWRRS